MQHNHTAHYIKSLTVENTITLDIYFETFSLGLLLVQLTMGCFSPVCVQELRAGCEKATVALTKAEKSAEELNSQLKSKVSELHKLRNDLEARNKENDVRGLLIGQQGHGIAYPCVLCVCFSLFGVPSIFMKILLLIY